MPYDLTNVPDSQFFEEPGRYDVLITNVKPCVSRKKFTEGIALTMQDAHGRTVIDTIWNPDDQAVMWRWKRLAKASKLPEHEYVAFEPEMLKGRTVNVELVLQDEKYIVPSPNYRESEAEINPETVPAPAERHASSGAKYVNDDVPF